MLLTPPVGAAQRVLGPGPEAVTIPRGTLRTTILSENVLHRGRWNDGRAEDLGAGFSINGLAAPHLSWLRALDDAFSGLGVSGLNASLGATDLDLRQRLAVTRLGLEVGVTDWLTLSVDAPFVRARAEAQLRLRGEDGRAQAGLNPMLTGTGVPAANRTVVDRYATAAAALAARRDACQGNPAAHPECADILSELGQVNALIGTSAQFGGALATTYGAQGIGDGLPYVPLAGSVGEQALAARAEAFRSDFSRYGVTTLDGAALLPLGAQTPLDFAALQELVTGPNGYAARPMTRSTRQDLGDVDIGLRVRVFDSFVGDSARMAAARFGIRQTIGVVYRLGGGIQDLPDNFIDLGTGSGHDALGLRSFTDLVLNDRFWATMSLGWARGAAYDRVLRVPDAAGIEWLEPWRQTAVRVTPGSVFDLRVAPRVILNDYFSVGGEWRWRSQAQSRHDLASPAVQDFTGRDYLLSGAVLDAQSAWNEQRFAWSVSYSTLAGFRRGVARLPFEIGYTHEQSIGSSQGIVPRRWEDRVQLRAYTRLFGR